MAGLRQPASASWLKKNATAFARFFVEWTECGHLAERNDSDFPRLYRYRVALDFSFERELIAKSKKRRIRL